MTSREYLKGKLDVSNDVGEGLDKLLEQAEAEVQQRLGQAVALKDGADKVRLLHTHIDKDFEEGKLKGVTDLEGLATVKLYVTRAAEVLMNLGERAKAEHLVASGKAAQARQTVEFVQRHATAARVSLEQAYAAAAEEERLRQPDAEREPRGGRPSVVERRQAPVQAKKKRG